MGRAIAGALAVAALLGGCGGDDNDTAGSVDNETVVRIAGTSATPQSLTVEQGSSVTFASGDGRSHSLLIAVDDGYRAKVPAKGTVEMPLDLPAGNYVFVIDGYQAPLGGDGPGTFGLQIK